MHILLDLDNTLLDFDRSQTQTLNRLFTFMGLTPSQDLHRLYNRINQTLWRQVEAGKLDLKSLKVKRFDQLACQCDLNFKGRTLATYYEQALSQQVYYLPGAVSLLENLSSHHKLYIASNGLSQVQRPRIQQSVIGKFVDAIFLSEEIGWAKPQPEFFQFIFKELGDLNPKNYLMIGDSLKSDILGGCKSGLTTIWYNPDQSPVNPEIVADHQVCHLSQIPSIIEKVQFNM